MEVWDREAIEILGPAFIEFGTHGSGRFRFIAVQGWMDCRYGQRDGHSYVEFTWDGDDEGDRASGRGWAVLDRDGSLRGHIYLHLPDDSEFRAVRTEQRSPTGTSTARGVDEPQG